MTERTLSLIKPDAMRARKVGRILSRIEETGLHIVDLKLLHLTRAEAEGFYQVHRTQPFYPALCEFMSSGPCVALVLEADNAVDRLREIMGDTDPSLAAPGSIRRDFGSSVKQNAIHGSDSQATAHFEIQYFFSGLELTESR